MKLYIFILGDGSPIKKNQHKQIIMTDSNFIDEGETPQLLWASGRFEMLFGFTYSFYQMTCVYDIFVSTKKTLKDYIVLYVCATSLLIHEENWFR